MNEALVEQSVCCALALKEGKCNRKQCNTCPVKLDIEYCMNTLSPYEKIEVSVAARQELERVETEMAYQRYETNAAIKQRRSLKTVLFIAIILLLLVIRGGIYVINAAEYPYTHYDYYVNDSCITDTLRQTRKNVYDRDGDRKINCIDYAITFKQIWDKSYPPDYCEIVRNYNTSGLSTMNHLFVRVKMAPAGKWLYIEPQAKYNKYNYKMSDFWGWPRYNSKYNHYGETRLWLSECKR